MLSATHDGYDDVTSERESVGAWSEGEGRLIRLVSEGSDCWKYGVRQDNLKLWFAVVPGPVAQIEYVTTVICHDEQAMEPVAGSHAPVTDLEASGDVLRRSLKPVASCLRKGRCRYRYRGAQDNGDDDNSSTQTQSRTERRIRPSRLLLAPLRLHHSWSAVTGVTVAPIGRFGQ